MAHPPQADPGVLFIKSSDQEPCDWTEQSKSERQGCFLPFNKKDRKDIHDASGRMLHKCSASAGFGSKKSFPACLPVLCLSSKKRLNGRGADSVGVNISRFNMDDDVMVVVVDGKTGAATSE